jgi:hypothetical protein
MRVRGWRTRICAGGKTENENTCGWEDGDEECKNSRKREQEDEVQNENVYRWGTNVKREQ